MLVFSAALETPAMTLFSCSVLSVGSTVLCVGLGSMSRTEDIGMRR